MNEISIEQQILDLVYASDYRPSKPKVIHQSLGLPDEIYPQVRRTIKRLTREGRVAFLTNHLVAPAGAVDTDPSVVRGIFRLANAGFGFVRPNLEGGKTPTDDIFIPARFTASAMDGDLVQVRVRLGRDGKSEGVVTDVVERGKRKFTGTYRWLNGKSVAWLDGVLQEHPIELGDVRGLPVKSEDKIIVEMVRYPDTMHPGEAVILEVLGSSRNPSVDTLAVMHQYALEEAFPESVIEQARHISDRFHEGLPEGRRDLTQVPTLTIDPIDARDFDDAISLRKNEVGHWELMVHIADVTHFVPAGTALDEEAKKRATSVYLPDKVIPMLPEIISNHLASLQPDKDRLAKTVFMELNDDGMLISWKVFNSVIRNAQRLNYEQVDQFLANRESWREKWSPTIFSLLGDMHTLAMSMRRRRMKNGSLELSLPKVKIDLDRGGKVKGAHLELNTESHQMIEEFMLSANQTVAMWLDDLEVPFLRRAHSPPKTIKARRLTQFIRELGIDCGSLEDRFELQRLIDSVHGTSTEFALNFAILKSMSKAVYQPEHEVHYALNFKHYCHFTSPIRRYPDLLVHRTVEKLLKLTENGEACGEPGKTTAGKSLASQASDPMPLLIHLGHHCSDLEQNAEAAERELTRVKLLHFMSKRIGETLAGVVTAVRAEGLLVQGNEIPAEGFVSVQALPPDRYRFDRDTHSIEGFKSGSKYRLGDELFVRVEQVDVARRQLFYSIVGRGKTAAAAVSTINKNEAKLKPRREKSGSKGKSTTKSKARTKKRRK